MCLPGGFRGGFFIAAIYVYYLSLPGSSVARYRACFGSRRSSVQIRPPRRKKPDFDRVFFVCWSKCNQDICFISYFDKPGESECGTPHRAPLSVTHDKPIDNSGYDKKATEQGTKRYEKDVPVVDEILEQSSVMQFEQIIP